MQKDLTNWLPLLVLAVLGLLAGLGKVLETGAAMNDDDVPSDIEVTSSADRGPGSLRSALFSAMRTGRHVTIRLQVPEITLELPLPPIVATGGMSIEGDLSAATIIRRGNDFVDEGAALLNIASDEIVLRNIAVHANGLDAVVVRGESAGLDGVEVHDAATAIRVFDAMDLNIVGSHIEKNDFGIRIEGNYARATISGNTFIRNRNTALWVVFAGEEIDPRNNVIIHDNTFSGGRNGIILANAIGELRGNRLSAQVATGISIIESRATLDGNRIVDGNGTGLHLSDLRDSLVADNEIGRNALVGIMILDADGLRVENNQIYGNGYGIAAVGRQPLSAVLRGNTLVDHTIDGLVTIGDTPVIDSNHALRNRRAGIRILDLVLPGDLRIEAVPQLANNVLSDNGEDGVLYGEYVLEAP